MMLNFYLPKSKHLSFLLLPLSDAFHLSIIPGRRPRARGRRLPGLPVRQARLRCGPQSPPPVDHTHSRRRVSPVKVEGMHTLLSLSHSRSLAFAISIPHLNLFCTFYFKLCYFYVLFSHSNHHFACMPFLRP